MITRKISLDIQENRCNVIIAIYLFGIRVRKKVEAFNTLLDAENTYDTLYKKYEQTD
jgi:hypothetical protein